VPLRSPVAALGLTLLPVSLSGQARTSAPNEVVWHWFGACATGDSLVLDVRLDGNALYGATFAICRVRRREIKPEPQQRILEFRFDGEPHRFRSRYHASGTQPIEGSIWEAGGDRYAIRLGVQLATEQQVLLNTTHVARAGSAARSERVRGLVITTRPVRRGGGARTPPRE
jgi:hypothetical protein